MKKILLSGILAICILGVLSGQEIVRHGVLDLRSNGFKNNPVMKLDGEWEFYWHKHLRPKDFISSGKIKPDLYGNVPAYWTEYKDSLPEITPTGFATYRMVILLPQYFRDKLIFKLPVFDSSYRIYIDGMLAGSNGVPGVKSSETKPGYNPLTIEYLPVSDRIEIIINVSNFHHRRGGFWLPAMVGTYDRMKLNIRRDDILTSGSLGILIAFTGFFFIFFLILRRDRSMLYFSLSTLGIMVRVMFTGSYQGLAFFNLQWEWLVRLEYLGTYFGFLFSTLYFYMIYKDNIIRYVNSFLIPLLGLLMLFVLVTPVSIFSYSTLIFIPVVTLYMLYYSARSCLALFRKRNYEGLLALGFIALLLAIVNDSLSSSSIVFISSGYILPQAVLLFIMMQAIILVFKWEHSYKEENRLLTEIEDVNRNLENVVIERTAELTNQKGELEIRNELYEAKNIELTRTIALKNRIFSIIAHDLKAPVLNLSLMIEDLQANNSRANFEKIVNNLAVQSGFAINLIENLMLWGQGQQNTISYSPGIHNLTNLVLDNFNLMREIAERKDIKLSYSHKGDSYAICDSDLVNIVIRNLVSNSIKFTERGGSVFVTAEEPSVKNGTINLKIKDNGIGIPPERVAILFKDEEMLSTPGTENEKGTGLGLKLCYDLVRINKGTISVDSKPGIGTTFTIMLPSPTNR